MSLRFKLAMLAIAVIVLVNSVPSLAGVQYLERLWLEEIQARVRRARA